MITAHEPPSLHEQINALHDRYITNGRPEKLRDELWVLCAQLAKPFIYNFKKQCGHLQTAHGDQLDDCSHIAFKQCLDSPRFDPAKGNFASYYLQAVRNRMQDAMRKIYSRTRHTVSVDFSGEYTHPTTDRKPNITDPTDIIILKQHIKNILYPVRLPMLVALDTYVQQSVRNPDAATYRLTADLEDMPIGTVKSRLHTIKNRLQILSDEINEMETNKNAAPKEILAALSESLRELIAEKRGRGGRGVA